MTKLVWDKPGERFFETGIDRGVLYLSDSSGGVPWNGLTGVADSRSTDKTVPYYLDGVKYLDSPQANDYAGTLTAYTYPDAFLPADGIADLGSGFLVDSQVPTVFGLSYRSLLGNDVESSDFGYNIHLLYNLTAVPSDKDYATQQEEVTPIEFSWDITGIPISTGSYRPSCHFMVNSKRTTSYGLAALEDILYGDDTNDARLPTPSEVLNILVNTVPV